MSVRMIVPLLFWALISQTGCILLPIPTPENEVLKGTQVTEEQLAFLAPNATMKSEVEARFGSPDIIWEDARLFVYNWVMRQGILIWALNVFIPVPGAGGVLFLGGGGGEDIPKRYMFLIQFDDQDRVQRFGKAVWPWGKSYGDCLKEWVGDSHEKPSEGANQRQD